MAVTKTYKVGDDLYIGASLANKRQGEKAIKVLEVSSYEEQAVLDGLPVPASDAALYKLDLPGAEGWFEEKYLDTKIDNKFKNP